ncbi:MAG: glycosyltransferase [Chloroflexota bacterium]
MYTSFFDDARFGDRIEHGRVRPWPLQRLVGPSAGFRSLYPLYAAYFGALRADADLLLTSSIAFTKAMRTRAGGMHISYIYTPMRYAWDLNTYLSESSYSPFARLAARTIRPVMQSWDRRTAQRPDRVVAISHTVRRRIEANWRREVDEVIYPPVRLEEMQLGTEDDGYYLVAARLLAYRRIDLAVKAFAALGRELVVVGDGPERARLEALAGPSVRFVGHLPREEVVRLFRRCHAYVVPGVEDFGIAPVEAMAAGKPVIAFRAGGSTETVDEGRTGVFFDEPSAVSLRAAVQTLDSMRFEAVVLRQHAQAFSADAFRKRWRAILENPATLGL